MSRFRRWCRSGDPDRRRRITGRGTVTYGTAAGAKGWTLRAEHLSGRYNTRWGDLPAV